MTRFLAALRSIPLMALAAAPLTLGAQRPTMPRVRPEPCDGYCNKVWASCARVTLRSAPSDTAPAAAAVDSGVRVTVLAGERHTISPGLVVARRPYTVVEALDGPDMRTTPARPRRWNLLAGDTVYVVDRESDGDSYENFVWVHRGRENTTARFWAQQRSRDARDPSRPVHLVSAIRQQWWVQVRGPRGETGWTQPGREWTGMSYYDDPPEKCAP